MSNTTVSEFFDSYAQEFDAIYGNRRTVFNQVLNKYFRKSMRLRFENTIDACHPIEGKTVADIGTGPGHYAVTLAQLGARHVMGLDFSEAMLNIGRTRAVEAGVAECCEFVLSDFLSYPFTGKFDYVILMGFMDYIADPETVLERAVSLTRSKAVFSFPRAEGLLAWQRKLRYKRRCDLFLYNKSRVQELFSRFRTHTNRIAIEPIARDYFVTIEVGE